MGCSYRLICVYQCILHRSGESWITRGKCVTASLQLPISADWASSKLGPALYGKRFSTETTLKGSPKDAILFGDDTYSRRWESKYRLPNEKTGGLRKDVCQKKCICCGKKVVWFCIGCSHHVQGSMAHIFNPKLDKGRGFWRKVHECKS